MGYSLARSKAIAFEATITGSNPVTLAKFNIVKLKNKAEIKKEILKLQEQLEDAELGKIIPCSGGCGLNVFENDPNCPACSYVWY